VNRDLFYVEHILECIERVERFSRGGEANFTESDLIQDAILRNLQVLAESTQRLSDDLKARYPTIDWRALGGFRNILVHEYLGVNLEGVWQIVALDLPVLRRQMEDIHLSLSPSQ
jgi:uncharacterized protein with HEPN domain